MIQAAPTLFTQLIQIAYSTAKVNLKVGSFCFPFNYFSSLEMYCSVAA